MSAVTRMPLMILAVWVWVAMVQSECITNPMDEINRKAQERYQVTDEFLVDMKKSSMNKYQNLLRVYGIYRACVESGTKRWTDGQEGSSSCPYCRTKIEDEDKIMIRPKWPENRNSTSCPSAKFCHKSQQLCFYYEVQESYDECWELGYYRDWRDSDHLCPADGNTDMHGNFTCQSCRDDEWIKSRWCPIICGYCGSRCGFFCKNYGYMERDSCTCICYAQYSGKRCEHLDCSLKDDTWCNTYSKKNCGELFPSVACSILCGLCDK